VRRRRAGRADRRARRHEPRRGAGGDRIERAQGDRLGVEEDRLRGGGGGSSFTLLHAYAGRRTLHHFDVYFTTAAIDLRRSGLDEALAAGGVAALEWGERFATELPPDRLEVELAHLSPESRRLRLSPVGPGAERWLARAGLPLGRP